MVEVLTEEEREALGRSVRVLAEAREVVNRPRPESALWELPDPERASAPPPAQAPAPAASPATQPASSQLKAYLTKKAFWAQMMDAYEQAIAMFMAQNRREVAWRATEAERRIAELEARVAQLEERSGG